MVMAWVAASCFPCRRQGLFSHGQDLQEGSFSVHGIRVIATERVCVVKKASCACAMESCRDPPRPPLQNVTLTHIGCTRNRTLYFA